MADNSQMSQSFRIQLPHRSCSSNMPGTHSYLKTFLNIWCKISSLIYFCLLSCLAEPHLYSGVLVNLLYCRLHLIHSKSLSVMFLCWFCCKHHWRIYFLDRKKQSALCWIGHPIICSILTQCEALYSIILLIVNKHPEILFELAFNRSVWLSISGWNAANILQSITNRVHICPRKVHPNCGPWLEMIFN